MNEVRCRVQSAISESGELYSFSDGNNSGLLGVADNARRYFPTKVCEWASHTGLTPRVLQVCGLPEGIAVRSMASSRNNMFATLADGTLWACGNVPTMPMAERKGRNHAE